MKQKRYRGLLGTAIVLLLLQTFPQGRSQAEPEIQQTSIAAEAAMAGAAMTLDKYFGGELVYDPDELLELVLGEENSTEEEKTGEASEEQKTENNDTGETETETVDELTTEPEQSQEAVTEATTQAVTLPPVTGYRGIAICKAENYCNVRALPSTSGSVLGKLYNCAIAEVVDEVPAEDGIWYMIASGTVVGYVRSDFFIVGNEALALYPQVVSRIGTVNAVNLRLRSTPDISVNNNIMTKLAFGTMVVVVGEEGDFYLIELDEGYYGYLHKQYVDVEVSFKTAVSLEEERIAKQKAEQARKEAEEAARREEEARREAEAAAAAAAAAASKEAAETITKITVRYVGPQKYAGNVFNATDLELSVHYLDEHIVKNPPGWGCATVGQALPEGQVKIVVVYGSFSAGMTITVLPAAEQPNQPVEPVTQPAETQPVTQPQTQPQQSSAYDELRLAICNYALQFVGNPYVYGGSDLYNGTDCSGFTMRVYQNFGISITRTSRSQAKAGRQVSLDNIRPGDLLFYDTNGTITHVALYIGNGKIVHAANKQLGILVMDAFYRMPCKAVTFLDTP